MLYTCPLWDKSLLVRFMVVAREENNNNKNTELAKGKMHKKSFKDSMPVKLFLTLTPLCLDLCSPTQMKTLASLHLPARALPESPGHTSPCAPPVSPSPSFSCLQHFPPTALLGQLRLTPWVSTWDGMPSGRLSPLPHTAALAHCTCKCACCACDPGGPQLQAGRSPWCFAPLCVPTVSTWQELTECRVKEGK